jgi:hypothetical protein
VLGLKSKEVYIAFIVKMFSLWNCLCKKKEKARRPSKFSTHHKSKYTILR